MAFNSTVSAASVLTDVFAEVISLDDHITKRAKAIVTNFVTGIFMDEMEKKDSLFCSLYQEVSYAGSFYDGLRVGEAAEFDLNVVLRLPFCLNDLKVCDVYSQDAQTYDVVSGYAVLSSDKLFDEMLHPNHQRYDDYKGLKRFFECRLTGIIFGKYYIIRPEPVLH